MDPPDVGCVDERILEREICRPQTDDVLARLGPNQSAVSPLGPAGLSSQGPPAPPLPTGFTKVSMNSVDASHVQATEPPD